MKAGELARWKMRQMTAGWRSLPDFIIIGAPRSGTITLYRLLGTHPNVSPAFKQETTSSTSTSEKVGSGSKQSATSSPNSDSAPNTNLSHPTAYPPPAAPKGYSNAGPLKAHPSSPTSSAKQATNSKNEQQAS